jgi:hypothetical protein
LSLQDIVIKLGCIGLPNTSKTASAELKEAWHEKKLQNFLIFEFV